jgi:hypothetical protein
VTGSDGIGDTPYVIDAKNRDKYPLINPWTPTEVSITVSGKSFPVIIETNTTISQVVSTPNSLSFTVSGPPGQKGYVLVVFPMVNTTDLEVYVDGNPLPPPFPTITSNSTHYFIYFKLTLSTHNIVISSATPFFVVPEYPLGTISSIAIFVAALAIHKSKRTHIQT